MTEKGEGSRRGEETDRHRHKETQTERQTDRDRERDTHTQRDTDRETDRQTDRDRERQRDRELSKLQALVYDILPSTTAVFSYAIRSRKLSANEQFFVGAQTVVSLLQTTQIIPDVCFITDHVAYASSDKTTIV